MLCDLSWRTPVVSLPPKRRVTYHTKRRLERLELIGHLVIQGGVKGVKAVGDVGRRVGIIDPGQLA